MSCVQEVSPDGVMLVTIQGAQTLLLISRTEKRIMQQIKNPSGDSAYSCLIPILNFNAEDLPFMVVKDERMVSLVNVKTGLAKKIAESLFDSCANASSLCQFIAVVDAEKEAKLKEDSKQKKKEEKKRSNKTEQAKTV